VTLEQTVVLVKPDGMVRGLSGRVITALEDRGLMLVACKLMQLDDGLMREHYAHLVERPFFPALSAFMSSSPILAMCWAGRDAISLVRSAIGATDAATAAPGTIRGMYASSHQYNIVHASEDADNAAAEVKRFFSNQEMMPLPMARARTVLAPNELPE
jgi:nucleoside-diphosphate kinase